jgi:hypothetical protein
MANISVSQLLFDPDFVDPVTVRRQVEVVGDDGLVTYTVQTFDIVASVQSMGGDNLFVDTDRSRATGTYEVITTFPLVVATDTTSADIVIWQGVEFIVTNVGRFGNFGGQYEGTMEIRAVSPPIGPR